MMGFGEDKIVRKSPPEIEKMRRSGQIVRQVLDHVKNVVASGATTMDLEKAAEKLIAELGATPAFKGYYGYPCVLCTSINEEIVHGIPSEQRRLKAGDIVSIDCGVVFDGYYGDAAITVPVGETLTDELKKLLEVTEASLYKGIEQAKIGNTVGHVGSAIQKHVETAGFSIVRDFVGHGIGTKLHEAPQIPNFGKKGQGAELSGSSFCRNFTTCASTVRVLGKNSYPQTELRIMSRVSGRSGLCRDRKSTRLNSS